MTDYNNIIFFDTECVFCSSFIRLLYRLDKKGTFYFSGLTGIEINNYNVDNDFKSILYMRNGIFFKKSSALLEIVKDISAFGKMVSWLVSILPCSFLDLFYDFVSKRRHLIFSNSNYCSVPNSEFFKRIIA